MTTRAANKQAIVGASIGDLWILQLASETAGTGLAVELTNPALAAPIEVMIMPSTASHRGTSARRAHEARTGSCRTGNHQQTFRFWLAAFGRACRASSRRRVE